MRIVYCIGNGGEYEIEWKEMLREWIMVSLYIEDRKIVGVRE